MLLWLSYRGCSFNAQPFANLLRWCLQMSVPLLLNPPATLECFSLPAEKLGTFAMLLWLSYRGCSFNAQLGFYKLLRWCLQMIPEEEEEDVGDPSVWVPMTDHDRTRCEQAFKTKARRSPECLYCPPFPLSFESILLQTSTPHLFQSIANAL